MLDQLGFIPKGGESFEYGNSRFSVVEMDGKRVARVKIQRIRPTEDRGQRLRNAADAHAPICQKIAKSFLARRCTLKGLMTR